MESFVQPWIPNTTTKWPSKRLLPSNTPRFYKELYEKFWFLPASTMKMSFEFAIYSVTRLLQVLQLWIPFSLMTSTLYVFNVFRCQRNLYCTGSNGHRSTQIVEATNFIKRTHLLFHLPNFAWVEVHSFCQRDSSRSQTLKFAHQHQLWSEGYSIKNLHGSWESLTCSF